MRDREDDNFGFVSRGLCVTIGRCRERPPSVLLVGGDEGIG